MRSLTPAPAGPHDVGGLTGYALDVVDRLAEPGIALLVIAETVFPPIPSEVVLPLGGYLAQQGRLELLGVLLAATAGSMVGSLLLYGLGARLGRRRATAGLARLPLVDAQDVDRAFEWFERHGTKAVLIGRLVPGVRSLVSLPAGSARMPLLTFSLLTLAGSTVWNTLLIAGGYALGTRYHLVERYTGYLDVALLSAMVLGLGWLVHRRLRRHRPG